MEVDEIELTVAREIDELLPAGAERSHRRLLGDHFHRREPRQPPREAVDRLLVGGAQVRFVEPAAALLGEDPRQPFAVEIGPAIARIAEAVRQVLEARPVDLAHRFVDRRSAVREIDRRHRSRDVAPGAVAPIAGLRHRLEERVRRLDRRGGRRGVREVGRSDQAAEADADLVLEVVEHQHAAAQPIRAHFESRSICRKRIHAPRPRQAGVSGNRSRRIVIAVVEHHLEAPVGGQRDGRGGVQIGKVRRAVAVADALQIALRGSRQVAAIALVRLREIEIVRALRAVLIDGDVPAIVGALAHQPAEDPARVGRIGDARLRRLAVPRRDVVLGDRSPERVGGISRVHPSLDAREQPLDPRPIAMDRVRLPVNGAKRRRARENLALPRRAVPDERRHEVLGARQDERVGFLRVGVLRQAFVGLSSDRRQRQRPPESERTVAARRVVGERQLWSEAGATGTRGDRHRQRCRPGRRIRGELLADPANGAAALRQRDRRARARVVGRLRGWRRQDRSDPRAGRRLVAPRSLAGVHRSLRLTLVSRGRPSFHERLRFCAGVSKFL